MQQGWHCQRCDRVNAPFITSCSCSSKASAQVCGGTDLGGGTGTEDAGDTPSPSVIENLRVKVKTPQFKEINHNPNYTPGSEMHTSPADVTFVKCEVCDD